MAASRFECPRCQTVFVKDIAGDAAFVECPSCGALALPAGDATEGALERALSGPQAAPRSGSLDSTEAEQPAAQQDPAAPAPGMFANLLDGAQSNPGGAPVQETPREAMRGSTNVSSSSNAPELGFDFGDINLDIALPPPPTGRSSEGAPINDGMSADSGKFRSQNAAVHAIAPEALQKLADDADAGPTNAAKPAPWSGLSEEAFGDLEKAFDEMALKPVPPTGHGRGLSTDEERFLRGDSEHSGQRPGPPPLRRVEGERTDRAAPPRPPPKGKAREKRPRPTHFELSVEARKGAFLPIDREGSVSMPRPRPAAEAQRSRAPEPSTSMPRPVMATGSTAETSEETDLVRNRENAEPRRKAVPSAFRGLSVGRAAAIVIVATLLGAGGGAMMAPKPKAAATARQRAELRFADGNRFYDAGRFDDALGAFRGALSIDPTFALAHRAKGAALAKLSRFDEAAEAYDEYLKLEPSAVDAPDVKNAIVRRRGPEKPAESKP